MFEKIEKLPKSSIVAILSAMLVYCLGKGYLDPDSANLISSVLTATGLGVNAMSGKFSKNSK